MSHIDKVLVVEDDDTLRLLTTKQLSRLGFASDAVEDGSHALKRTAEFTYCLILMDVQMPQLDGIEATLAIRQAEKDTGRERVPIIAVTANPDKSLCLNADMDDFLFKPVMLPELEQIVKKWVGSAKSASQSAQKSDDKNNAVHAGSASKDAPKKSAEPQFGFATASTSDTEPAIAAESGVTVTSGDAPEIVDATGSADSPGNTSGNTIE